MVLSPGLFGDGRVNKRNIPGHQFSKLFCFTNCLFQALFLAFAFLDAVQPGCLSKVPDSEFLAAEAYMGVFVLRPCFVKATKEKNVSS